MAGGRGLLGSERKCEVPGKRVGGGGTYTNENACSIFYGMYISPYCSQLSMNGNTESVALTASVNGILSKNRTTVLLIQIIPNKD